MGIPVNLPLIPGFFYEVKPNHFRWVFIRYKEPFVYYKKCGKARHKSTACRTYIRDAERCMQDHIIAICGGMIYNLIVARPAKPLFSNKMRGLRNLDKFITTRVNLFVYPYPPFSIDDDSESDPSSNDNDGNGKPPQVQEQGEASMKRKGKIIILENHNLHRHRHRLLTRQLPFLDPVQGRWNHYVKKGVWIS